MIPLLLLVGLGLGVALLSSGEPSVEGATFVRWQPPADTLPRFDTPARTPADVQKRLAILRSLRPDAGPWADGYSRHRWEVAQATWSNGQTAGYYTPAEIEAYNKGRKWADQLTPGLKGGYVDEYGRVVPGYSQSPVGPLLQAAGIALPFIPGIGPAASAALAGLIALGQGKSLKDAALAAARAAIPGGALAQAGFDAAVAVASGEPVDDAVVNSFLAQYPAAKAGYEQGKEAYKALHSEYGA